MCAELLWRIIEEMNDPIKDAPGKQAIIQDWGLSFDQVPSGLGYETDESTDEGLEDKQEKMRHELRKNL